VSIDVWFGSVTVKSGSVRAFSVEAPWRSRAKVGRLSGACAISASLRRPSTLTRTTWS
jgi:hypothetical protein